MRKRDLPIIESLMDTDFYKLSMGQMIFHRHPKVPVEFSFFNRSKGIQLANKIDIGQLREELENCRNLRFTPQELHYIMGTYEYGNPMFKFDYIDFLRTMRLPEFQLEKRDGQIDLRFAGEWAKTTYWEIFAMSIVNELYFESLMKGYTSFQRDQVEARGRLNLGSKLATLANHPNITWSEFGTRRRFSRTWQDYVVKTMKEECGDQFRGTSNTFLASKYGLMPVGTNAHELSMVYSGIFHDSDNVDHTYSQKRVLNDWDNEYGYGLSIFLPDTFGSDWFFKNCVDSDMLRRWKGSRQDSGEPLEYAEKRIWEYINACINPMDKLIIFADGLTADKMVQISEALYGRIQNTFGWGTDASNDLGFKSISIVVKPTLANGHKVAKLTDNVAKATGSVEAVERMKTLVGYTNTFQEECRS